MHTSQHVLPMRALVQRKLFNNILNHLPQKEVNRVNLYIYDFFEICISLILKDYLQHLQLRWICIIRSMPTNNGFQTIFSSDIKREEKVIFYFSCIQYTNTVSKFQSLNYWIYSILRLGKIKRSKNELLTNVQIMLHK